MAATIDRTIRLDQRRTEQQLSENLGHALTRRFQAGGAQPLGTMAEVREINAFEKGTKRAQVEVPLLPHAPLWDSGTIYDTRTPDRFYACVKGTVVEGQEMGDFEQVDGCYTIPREP